MGIKNIRIVKDMYSFVKKNITKLSPELAIKLIYRVSFGKKLNLNNPRMFSEKLMWLNLYWNDDIKVKCSDKYEVRKYIEEIGEGNTLNELYNVYDSVDEINWNELPEKFVLKCTHGSGTNIICKSKKDLNIENAICQLNKWMKTDYSLFSAELHYSKIKPRIICEKYIETENGGFPIDYKIYCFNGEPKITLVCEEREKGKTKQSYYDKRWNRIYIEAEESNISDVIKPVNYDKMLSMAERVSKNIPFVRVDLYDFQGNILFGEMTFTPRGCLNTNISEDAQKQLGNWLSI